MEKVDLHVHSNASDGTNTPAELVRYAKKKGLAAIALTDHDTTDGISEAEEEGKKEGVEVVPGIELSSEYQGGDIHVLGFFLEREHSEFQKHLQQFRHARDVRNEEMAEKLRKCGFAITLSDMRAVYKDAVLTRAHFAKYLVNAGALKSYEEAFEKYLGKGCPCYVPRRMITPQRAIELIQKANGVAVLAHPLLYHMKENELKELILQLKEAGLKGIEGLYSLNSEQDDKNMWELAKEMGLLLTGGSDFHGQTKPDIDLGTGRGRLDVPKELLDELRKKSSSGIR